MFNFSFDTKVAESCKLKVDMVVKWAQDIRLQPIAQLSVDNSTLIINSLLLLQHSIL